MLFVTPAPLFSDSKIFSFTSSWDATRAAGEEQLLRLKKKALIISWGGIQQSLSSAQSIMTLPGNSKNS